jgi:hypothetical protein
MPCPDCGASLATAEREEHVCDPERRLDYQMFQLRDEIESFESEVGRYLDSSHGRFDVWRAERERTSDGGEAS